MERESIEAGSSAQDRKNVILDEDHTHTGGGQLKKRDLDAQREQAY